MAAFTSKATGNWSAAGQTTWNEVGVPVAGDTVTIANTHVVTVDDTSRASAAITLNGTLKASRAASCKLAYSGTITVNSTGYLDWGTEASPIPAAYTATLEPASGVGITLSSSSYGGRITFRGDSGRTAWTTLASTEAAAQTVISVTDATGWQDADQLLFVPASSTNNNANHTEVRTIATGGVSGNNVTITAGLTYEHIAGGRVYNMTRNCILNPASATSGPTDLRFDADVNTALGTYFRWARFENMGNSAVTGGFSFASGHANVSTVAEYGASRVIDDIDSCVFYRTTGNSVPHIVGVQNREYLPVYDTAFIDTSTGGNGVLLAVVNNMEFIDCTMTAGDHVLSYYANTGATPLTATRCWFSAGTQYGSYFTQWGISGAGVNLTDCIFSGRFTALFGGAAAATNGTVVDSGSDWGYTYGIYCQYKMLSNVLPSGGYTDFTSTSGKFNATYTDVFNASGFTINRSTSRARLWNKNNSTATQEYYTPQCRFSRETTTVKNAPSSLKAEITTTDNLAQSYTFQILAKNGDTLQLRGYLNKNAAYGSSTRPSVTVSGLGVVAVAPSGSTTYTMTDVTDWEAFDLHFSQSSGADGLLDVTFTVQSSSATAIAYLGGIAISPFVTRTRHYGYQVLETSPTVLVDPAIDPAISEATAAAYTGIGITWGATSSIATSADTTFKKLVHYTAATMDTNVSSAMPITWAGAYAAPAIFAQGAINISGDTLNGSGSIDMGSNTLTATGPFSYTYTGGTFSQATTVPSFSGGTLNIGAAGTFTYTQASSMSVTVDPSANDTTYNFGSGVFTGTLTVNLKGGNTKTGTIVQVPSGTSTATTSDITFSAPQVYQSVVITGFTAGSRIYIYDTEGAGELLFNGTVSAGETVISGSTCTWTDATAAAANRVIFLRVAYVNGATAKEFIEVANIGTCGTTDGTKTVSYIVAQTADAVYDANAVTMDGTIFAACGITFTDAATDLVNINIAADTVALKTIYAAFAWWIFTSPGIDDDVAYIRAIDPANYELTSMKFRNTSTDPLKITDGYFYDSTGSVENCVDVAGSSGNIYPMPAHVVPYQTTGTYAITGSLQDALDAIADVPADVLAAAQTTPIHSDVRKVNSYTVDGDGQSGTEWGPA